jgi:transcriptional regulator with XRE-family HTH domain
METSNQNPNKVLVGRNIRHIRELKRWKQDYMASQLGISQKAYSKIENGETNISVNRIIEIAKILEVDVADLLNQDGQVIIGKVTKNQSVNFAQGNVTNHNNGLEARERELYEKRIQHLEEEIAFLRKMMEK